MIYNVFDEQDKENLIQVFTTMNLLENDYLGSSGSRGYGKISFKEINIYWNSKEDYEKGDTDTKDKTPINEGKTTLVELIKNAKEIKTKISG